MTSVFMCAFYVLWLLKVVFLILLCASLLKSSHAVISISVVFSLAMLNQC